MVEIKLNSVIFGEYISLILDWCMSVAWKRFNWRKNLVSFSSKEFF